MKILMVASEAVPYVKTGGLADCVSALSRQLVKCGHDVRLLLPYYGAIPEKLRKLFHPLPGILSIRLKDHHWARLHEHIEPSGLRVYLVEYQHFFGRNRLYDDGKNPYTDNPQRFAFFCRAAVDLPEFLNWTPDIFHCHDWMASLVPVFLETTDRYGLLSHAGSVLTIHNLAHQGYAHHSILEFANLPASLFRSDQLEACGGVNFLKGGIHFANKLTTVSPTYAQEIQTAQFGCGLQDVLKFRSADLIGIMNGIDINEWDPKIDSLIPHRFSANLLRGKKLCKDVFQKNNNLAQESGMPLFGVVSRLCEQKGLDIFAEIIPKLLDSMHLQIAVLGAGDRCLEEKFSKLAAKYPEKLAVRIGYDEIFAHEIEAASDFFVMPSRFEPCGLNQLYSLRYGTLPIVRVTGGLVDSVQNYDERTVTGTGFCFNDLTHSSLYNVIGWACSTYYDRPAHIKIMQKRAMEQNFSWEKSAEIYRLCYTCAAETKRT